MTPSEPVIRAVVGVLVMQPDGSSYPTPVGVSPVAARGVCVLARKASNDA